ncbi:MAG: alpha-amylase family glycosyl hydrolase [Bacteroidota bacterium]
MNRRHLTFGLLVFVVLWAWNGVAGQTARDDGWARCYGNIQRIDPPCWWTGMQDTTLQMLAYLRPGTQSLASHSKETWRLAPGTTGLRLRSVRAAGPTESEYVWLDWAIEPGFEPQNVELQHRKSTKDPWKTAALYPFGRKSNPLQSATGVGWDASDLVYLVMPDRFANGDRTNDRVEGLREQGVNRAADQARHGGDLQGLLQNLDYIQSLGVTALWLNPVLENDLPKESYHGYAATDVYGVDPRLGTPALYKKLVEQCGQRGIKVIMDIVHNHWGLTHPLLAVPVDSSWVHRWPAFTRSNYRAITQMDPYAQSRDQALMRRGWFDHPMPDLDQTNEDLQRYLIQNNLWWLEYAGLSGYRIDTYAYPDTRFMRRWTAAMQREYPKVGLVGEVWVHSVPESAYWTEDFALFREPDSVRNAGPGLPSVTDFPVRIALVEGLNEKMDWDRGLRRIYTTLAQDFLYKDASRNLIFLDNHDVSRAWSEMRENPAKARMAYRMLYTLRGVPQLYYGSELLFGNFASLGGSNVRQDMPGGWERDTISVFEAQGLSPRVVDFLEEMKRLGQWRKGSEAVAKGRFEHYIPEDEVYVYARTCDTCSVNSSSQRLLVLVNASETPKRVTKDRYAKHWPQGTVREQPYGVTKVLGDEIVLEPLSCTLLEW